MDHFQPETRSHFGSGAVDATKEPAVLRLGRFEIHGEVERTVEFGHGHEAALASGDFGFVHVPKDPAGGFLIVSASEEHPVRGRGEDMVDAGDGIEVGGKDADLGRSGSVVTAGNRLGPLAGLVVAGPTR